MSGMPGSVAASTAIALKAGPYSSTSLPAHEFSSWLLVKRMR
jgi:hypothetical protein